MTKLTSTFVYLITLAVVQPARIQDIEAYAPELVGATGTTYRDDGSLRRTHDMARNEGLVIAIRKGVYVLSKFSQDNLRTSPISQTIDNRRLFLIKKKRKAII